MNQPGTIRLGLCCIFKDVPIRFRSVTAKRMLALDRPRREAVLGEVCLANAEALAGAIAYCGAHGIGAFRVNSQILPLKTHPQAGYAIGDLPEGEGIQERFVACGHLAAGLGVRLSFHPDQFIVLGTPHAAVAQSSMAELEYQAEVAEWIGADVIVIHAGGSYGDKPTALDRWRTRFKGLSERARMRLALENDDRVYTPSDLLPLCEQERIPFVYDVHHHRCLPDGVSETETTRRALDTWPREPLFHVSSPKHGWNGKPVTAHHDYIDVRDFPNAWRPLTLTVDVEAKAKELAVERLARDLVSFNVRVWGGTKSEHNLGKDIRNKHPWVGTSALFPWEREREGVRVVGNSPR